MRSSTTEDTDSLPVEDGVKWAMARHVHFVRRGHPRFLQGIG